MKIVLSYRRDDAAGTTDRIYDRLAERYGEQNVFMDVDSLLAGVDFYEHIQEVLNGCDILLAIIGPRWIGERSGKAPRIKDKDDWVRIEVETALQRNIPVVPVLVEGAKLPKGDQLPKALQALLRRQVAPVGRGPEFRFHVDLLIRSLDNLLEKRTEQERLAKEQEAKTQQKAEKERLAREQEQARQKAEKERLAREQEAKTQQKAEKERLAREQEQARQKAEKERLAREQEQARQKAEKERLAREQEQARQKAEKERLAREQEQARQKAEKERLAREQEQARQKAEKERLAKEQEAKTQQKAEKERLARDLPITWIFGDTSDKALEPLPPKEIERLVKEEAARQKAEKERLAREQEQARQKAEKERLAREPPWGPRQKAEKAVSWYDQNGKIIIIAIATLIYFLLKLLLGGF